MITEKHKLHDSFLRTRNITTSATFKKLWNRLDALLKKAKEEYYENLFQTGSPTWSYVEKIIINSILSACSVAKEIHEIVITY